LKAKQTNVRLTEFGRDILRYLARNPDAGDTVEGIVQWWLLEQQIERRIADAKAELHLLTISGFVREFRDHEGRMHYRVNPDKLAELREILTEPKNYR
jgi:Fe2+ or Zn2+ uptake regulation protein